MICDKVIKTLESTSCRRSKVGGGTHILIHTEMCHSNASLFRQEIPQHGSHFLEKYP